MRIRATSRPKLWIWWGSRLMKSPGKKDTYLEEGRQKEQEVHVQVYVPQDVVELYPIIQGIRWLRSKDSAD